jgi:hypothetical protein
VQRAFLHAKVSSTQRKKMTLDLRSRRADFFGKNGAAVGTEWLEAVEGHR